MVPRHVLVPTVVYGPNQRHPTARLFPHSKKFDRARVFDHVHGHLSHVGEVAMTKAAPIPPPATKKAKPEPQATDGSIT